MLWSKFSATFLNFPQKNAFFLKINEMIIYLQKLASSQYLCCVKTPIFAWVPGIQRLCVLASLKKYFGIIFIFKYNPQKVDMY
jgi:hypothetical protein